jgi:GNAT superfamily N-acetyltransferase
MTEAVVMRVAVADIEASPDLPALLAEYAAESANDEIGPATPQIATYRGMEAAGMMQAFAAVADGQLVGFLFLLTPVLPHFGKKVGVTESYFVAAVHRSTGAGLKLLAAAESAAKEAGAAGILVSAPSGGRLERVMPGIGYRETNRVFFKGLK